MGERGKDEGRGGKTKGRGEESEKRSLYRSVGTPSVVARSR
jgi:hypothetical protein